MIGSLSIIMIVFYDLSSDYYSKLVLKSDKIWLFGLKYVSRD